MSADQGSKIPGVLRGKRRQFELIAVVAAAVMGGLSFVLATWQPRAVLHVCLSMPGSLPNAVVSFCRVGY